MFGSSRWISAFAVAAALAASAACSIDDTATDEDSAGSLGNAIVLCTAGSATNVETSYEQIAEMLAKVSVSNSVVTFETTEEVRRVGGVPDPTNSNEDANDYVDQPGEIACVTEDGRLTFNVGGIILFEAQKLMAGQSMTTPTTSPSPSTTTFITPSTTVPPAGGTSSSEQG